MKKLFLSRRNLETLLAKLEARKAGEFTTCSITKPGGRHDPDVFSSDTGEVCVIAVEDEDYYVSRPAGYMNPNHAPPVRHKTGVGMDPELELLIKAQVKH